MPILRLENISHAYGHVPLLTDVDFQVDAGERVCLIGRNGTGKSSLLEDGTHQTGGTHGQDPGPGVDTYIDLIVSKWERVNR